MASVVSSRSRVFAWPLLLSLLPGKQPCAGVMRPVRAGTGPEPQRAFVSLLSSALCVCVEFEGGWKPELTPGARNPRTKSWCCEFEISPGAAAHPDSPAGIWGAAAGKATTSRLL